MSKAIVDTNVLLRLIVKDDEIKRKACEKLLEKTRRKEIVLHILPVTVLEVVWVLEKYYKLDRKTTRGLAEAILNTPGFRCEMEDVFRKALRDYEEKNIKFADAVIGHWGMENGLSTVYTYDEKHFRKIEGLEVKRP